MPRTFLALPVVLLCSAAASAADARPNILFIMSDDHGYQAISAYGSKINQTPNIDRIAREGIRFDRAFVTNSICGPSRAVIVPDSTGRPAGKSRLPIVTDPVKAPCWKAQLPVTLAKPATVRAKSPRPSICPFPIVAVTLAEPNPG